MNFFFVCFRFVRFNFVSNWSTMDATVNNSKFKSLLEKISANDFAMAISNSSLFIVVIVL